MDGGELVPEFTDVSSLKIDFQLQISGPFQLKVELLPHFGELIVHRGQDIGA